jgi:hypothetical protein
MRRCFDTCHRLGKAGFDMGYRAIRDEGSTTGNELEREVDWMMSRSSTADRSRRPTQPCHRE